MKQMITQNIIPASTVMNATINSSPIPLPNIFSYSIQIFFTGTPTGIFKLQASADPVAQAQAFGAYTSSVAGPVNWTDVANSSFSVSAAGNVMWTVSDPGYNWVRVVYTDSSGGSATSIVTTATANGKGV